jgi:3-deoxy-D-manno-octulosonic-acid transferase
MGRSTGLSLYLFAKSLGRLRAGGALSPRDWPARPPGSVLWIRAAGGAASGALDELARRLSAEAPTLTVIQSGIPPGAHSVGLPVGMIADEPRAVASLLAHWRPDAALLAGPFDAPATLAQLGDAGVPCLVADASLPHGVAQRLRLLPGAGRSLFAAATAILCRTPQEAAAFRAAGADPALVEAPGPMQDGPSALPYSEADRADLAGQLIARPVWAAITVPKAEIDTVLDAHLGALRSSHRLLLIVVPADENDHAAITDAAHRRGLRIARRSAAEEPDSQIQVYVAEAGSEFGLWYRIAPIAYLGATISGQGAPRDPLEAASLGSAILAGPNGKDHGGTLRRLTQAGAARAVRSAPELGEAVSDLLSPDRAALMAGRAWDIATRGAEATDRVIECVGSALDAAGRA